MQDSGRVSPAIKRASSRTFTRYTSALLATAMAIALTPGPTEAASAHHAAVSSSINAGTLSGSPFSSTNTAAQDAAWTSKFQSDMTQAHQAQPAGVPSYWSWAQGPVIGAGNTAPAGYGAITMWGQVYEAAPSPGAIVAGMRVELLNPQLWIYSKSQGKWVEMQSSTGVQGAHFAPDFANNANIPADTQAESDGGTSVSMVSGYNFHYWPTGSRVAINPSDIGGITTAVQARLIPTTPQAAAQLSTANYLVNVGADYWPSTTASSPGPIGIMEGRFTYATSSYQWYTADTQFGSTTAP